MREEILNTALELADLIEFTANGAIEAGLNFEEAKSQLAVVEAMIIGEIAAEVDDKGKAIFSNETARAAELIVRKRSSELFQQGTALLNSSMIAKAKIQNMLEKDRNKLAVYKAFLAGGQANV